MGANRGGHGQQGLTGLTVKVVSVREGSARVGAPPALQASPGAALQLTWNISAETIEISSMISTCTGDLWSQCKSSLRQGERKLQWPRHHASSAETQSAEAHPKSAPPSPGAPRAARGSPASTCDQSRPSCAAHLRRMGRKQVQMCRHAGQGDMPECMPIPGPACRPHEDCPGPATRSPQPSAELSVLPWMWVAAMPVAAVTATRCANSAPNSPRKSSMMAFSRKDLPVPASHVRGGGVGGWRGGGGGKGGASQGVP